MCKLYDGRRGVTCKTCSPASLSVSLYRGTQGSDTEYLFSSKEMLFGRQSTAFAL